VRHPDRGDPVAARKGRCRRALFELIVEHGIRPARHGESAREDHDRRGGCVYVDRISAWFTDLHWQQICVAVGAGERPNSDSHAGTASIPRRASHGARNPGGITVGEQVGGDCREVFNARHAITHCALALR